MTSSGAGRACPRFGPARFDYGVWAMAVSRVGRVRSRRLVPRCVVRRDVRLPADHLPARRLFGRGPFPGASAHETGCADDGWPLRVGGVVPRSRPRRNGELCPTGPAAHPQRRTQQQTADIDCSFTSLAFPGWPRRSRHPRVERYDAEVQHGARQDGWGAVRTRCLAGAASSRRAIVPRRHTYGRARHDFGSPRRHRQPFIELCDPAERGTGVDREEHE